MSPSHPPRTLFIATDTPAGVSVPRGCCPLGHPHIRTHTYILATTTTTHNPPPPPPSPHHLLLLKLLHYPPKPPAHPSWIPPPSYGLYPKTPSRPSLQSMMAAMAESTHFSHPISQNRSSKAVFARLAQPFIGSSRPPSSSGLVGGAAGHALPAPPICTSTSAP